MRWIHSLLLFAAAACLGADREPFFVQMSDPQFGMVSNNNGFKFETRNLERAVQWVNRLRPAFVVVTGDLVNRPADPAQVGEYRRIMAGLDRSIPLYNVPGNHDIGNQCSAESLQAWRRTFGRDHYSFQSGALYGIVLNTVLLSAPGECAAEAAAQETWLAEELEKARRARARHVVVFQHHPPFVADAEEAAGYHNLPVPARRRYLELLGKSTVSHVFAGHLHRNAEGRAGGIAVITTGAVGKPLGGSRSGLRVVKFGGRVLEHQYHALEEMPGRIE